MSASINYDASGVSLAGLSPSEIRDMNQELREFVDNLFERYGVTVQEENNSVRTGETENKNYGRL